MFTFSLSLWVLAFGLIILVTCQKVSVRAWASQGYYYSHRCQINIEVVSNYFESSYQLFHILAKENAYFFNTVEYDNVFYVKGTNSMEAIMNSNELYCKFPMSSTYFCPFISINGYDPYGLRYYETVNATHRKLILRLSRPICPAEGKKMALRIQMPIASDYQDFYMHTPAITDKAILTVDKLSFVYDQEVEVNLAGLEHKQVKEIRFTVNQRNFVSGCKVNLGIGLKFQNLTYFDSIDQISIYISNQQILQLSTTCTSNTSKPHQCSKTSYGYQLIILNQINMNKSYQIAEQEYYSNEAVWMGVEFGLGFGGSGVVDVEVVGKVNDNGYMEQWLNMTHDRTEVYGRAVKRVESFGHEAFVMLSGDKYDPLKCLIPIIINTEPPVSNTTDTNTTTNNTIPTPIPIPTPTPTTIPNNTDSTVPQNSNHDYTFDTTTGFEVDQLIFLLLIILIVPLTIKVTYNISLPFKLTYLLTLLILALAKVAFVVVGVNEAWLQSSDPSLADSLTLQNKLSQYSLEIFILKSTFLLQFLFNLFYLLNYLIFLTCSQQLSLRIRKFYGSHKPSQSPSQTKAQNQSKFNKKYCNFSSILYTSVTFLMFLLSYKFYGALVFKLQLNIDPNDSDFKRYRFKNSVLYKMHAGHVSLDLMLQCNALMWAFLLTKSSHNQVFTIVLYVFIGIYALHVFLLAKVLKVFYMMGQKSDELSLNQEERLKVTCSQVQEEIENEQNQDEASDVNHNEPQSNQPEQLIEFHLVDPRRKTSSSISSKFMK